MSSKNGSPIMTPATSTTDSTLYTPESTARTTIGEVWDGRHFTVPSAGNTYQIFQRGTKNAILMTEDGGAYVGDIDYDKLKHNVWLCVEKNGYFGFTQLGRYLGHTMSGHMHAWANNFENWEYFVIKKHQDGGYQLMMPHWWYSLKTVRIVGNGPNLELGDHGTTFWEFVKVDQV
ncbi:hypothetical protein PT974_04748 [Cladobotryum mycophilum]|uniref:Fascin domain-containing protein n=1 Tax=Cladobotryum mycophilum TaxID=491253 RepID=A0ABR0SR77_9HYPO